MMYKLSEQQNKDWLESVTAWGEEFGCFPHLHCTEFDRHHVLGRTYKQNKVHIGLAFVLPIDRYYHDVHLSKSRDDSVTHFPRVFEEKYGYQREMFEYMLDSMYENDYYIPFGHEVIEAIMSTKVWAKTYRQFNGRSL